MLCRLFFFSLIFVHISFSNCFFGTHFKDGVVGTKSHTDITRIGTSIAFAEYIMNRKGSDSMEDFFKDGKCSIASLLSVYL